MTLREAVGLLSDAGVPDAKYDAREIFRLVGHISEATLPLNPATDDPAVLAALARRAAREPLGYILGEVGFFGLTFRVTPDVLIPRPDTETLVGAALDRLKAGAHVLDLCTGSGCVALSVLRHTENTDAVCVDVSEAALAVARDNAERLGLSDRTRLLHSDVLSDAPVAGTFDAILSNPPYVIDAVYPTLAPEVLAEPSLAFLGGEDGMTFYRAILSSYGASLSPDGFFAFEIGYDEEEKIRALAAANACDCTVLPDLSGNPRAAILKKRSPAS